MDLISMDSVTKFPRSGVHSCSLVPLPGWLFLSQRNELPPSYFHCSWWLLILVLGLVPPQVLERTHRSLYQEDVFSMRLGGAMDL
ncbi:hypothetical protein NPIL_207021 [Nephila pilipes]|uniref:Uncharacterized protein n=1 Tax=Nephila pilipes TaxID=299642 RepID=A0A8X6N1P1_NEPPI|nr:hypothetical protein NPIL_207021 [Nephila pilipes]